MFKIMGYIHTKLRREIFLFDEGGGEHTLSWNQLSAVGTQKNMELPDSGHITK